MDAKRIAAAALMSVGALVLAAGCSTNKVRTQYEVEVGFRGDRYRDYAWVTEASLIHAEGRDAELSPTDDRRIRESVDRALAEKGYRRVESWEAADVLVTYTAQAAERHVWREIAGSNYRYHGFNGPLSGQVDPIRKLQRQTWAFFSVQLYDPDSREPLWLGAGDRRITAHHPRDQLIDRIVRHILEPLPQAS